jgi:hypothetical protein
LLHEFFPGGALLPEDHHNGNQANSISGTSAGSSMEVIEFNWPLYVYQRRARTQEEFQFTIAVWNGTKLMPICHLQPFQTALGALGQALMKAGQSQSASTRSANCGSNGLNTERHTEAHSNAKSLSTADDNGQPQM